MSGFVITCVNKNQHGLIVRLGGEGWSLGIQEAVNKLLSRQIRLNIRVDGRYAEVGLRGEGWETYLVIEPDGFPLHALSDLPSC